MEFDDVRLMHDEEEPINVIEGDLRLELSGKVEADFLDALMEYLKD